LSVISITATPVGRPPGENYQRQPAGTTGQRLAGTRGQASSLERREEFAPPPLSLRQRGGRFGQGPGLLPGGVPANSRMDDLGPRLRGDRRMGSLHVAALHVVATARIALQRSEMHTTRCNKQRGIDHCFNTQGRRGVESLHPLADDACSTSKHYAGDPLPLKEAWSELRRINHSR
jgi:hypothetical protein